MTHDDVVFELDCSSAGFEQLLFDGADTDLERRVSLAALTDLAAAAFAMPATLQAVAFDVHVGELPDVDTLRALRLELHRSQGEFKIACATRDQPGTWKQCAVGAKTVAAALQADANTDVRYEAFHSPIVQASFGHVSVDGSIAAMYSTDGRVTLRFELLPDIRKACSHFNVHPAVLGAVLRCARQPLIAATAQSSLQIQRLAITILEPGATPAGLVLTQGAERVGGDDIWTRAVIVDATQRALASLELHASSSVRCSSEPLGLSTERLADLAAEALGRSVPFETNLLELELSSIDLVRLITTIYAACRVQVPMAEFLARPTLAHLYDLVRERADAAEVDLVRRLEEIVAQRPGTAHEMAALTSMQQALWLASLRPQAGPAYFERAAWKLSGNLNVAALRAAWLELSLRYEALRCGVIETNGRLSQVLLEPETVLLHDASDGRGMAADSTRDIDAWLSHERELFVQGAPLARIELLRLSADQHVLLLTAHHSVCDGTSLHERIVPALNQLYAYSLDGFRGPQPAPSAQPRDLAAWEMDAICAPKLAADVEAWTAELARLPAPAELPADVPRDNQTSCRAGRVQLALSDELFERLAAFARHERQSRFVISLSAFFALLYRFSGERDLLVGVPIAQRFSPLLANAVGCLINFAPIHVRMEGTLSLSDVVRQVSQQVASVLARQQVPFQRVAERLAESDHSAVANPCVGFSYEAPAHELALRGLTTATLDPEPQATKLELFVRVEQRATGLQVSFEYAADLFAAETIQALVRRYERFLRTLIEDPSTRIRDLAWLLPDEHDTALRFAHGPTLSEGPLCPERLAARAVISDTAIAVTDGAQQLSYRALLQRADRLAQTLRTEGVQHGDCVALYLEACLDWPVAVLAVWKVGAAIVPIDAEQPLARQAQMFETAQLQVAIGYQAHAAQLAAFNVRTIAIDEPRAIPENTTVDAAIGPRDLAYGIFTSGSTGRPKLALAQHAGLANKVAAQLDVLCVREAERVLQFASPAFDAALSEMLLALSAGATLVIPPVAVRHSGKLLAELLQRESIAVAMLTPSVAAELPAIELPALRLLLLIGERCRAELVAIWSPRCDVYNLYGPTETSIWATSERCQPGTGDPSLGRPIANTWIYILDAELNLLGPGHTGEICIGGAGVGPGYRNGNERDQARFVADPYHPARLMYRTGDRGRYLPDGRIAFLGREDDQVKLFGRRIELSEIEAALRRLPGVDDAVVVVHELGTPQAQLSAFVQTQQPNICGASIREALRAVLPHYMLPVGISVVTEWPRLLSGKVDRRQLAARPISRVPSSMAKTAAQDRIAQVFANVLGIAPDAIGPFDDFFVLGGHSLSVVTLAEALASEGLSIAVVELMRGACVADIAARLEPDLASDSVELSEASS